ncbi:amino acid adenylation domain-containing protein [Gordonia caeni]|uniref:amino acid adenylation domain-containing protein n=1 Tax=Gordonia caeni TaxID=1007097 RepID=UPI003CD0A8D4
MADVSGSGDARNGREQRDLFPLTPAQRGMWFADKLAADYSVNIAQYIDIRHEPGDLDVDLLVDCSYAVGRELETPYIRLAMVDGVPMQYVDFEYDQKIDLYDLRAREDPVKAALAWINKEFRRPIDLINDQLIVVAIIKVADDHTILYQRAHHLIVDGYAALTNLRRVLERYNAMRRGEEVAAKPVGTLADIVAYEESYRTSTRRQTDRTYWQVRTQDLPERVTLAQSNTDAPLSFDNAVAGGTLANALQRDLELVAREMNSSVAVVLTAAFSAFLARMTGGDDIVLSLAVSGRTTARVRNSGGMVSNVLPIRLGGVRASTVAELIRSAQLELTGALRHQRYRTEDIRRDSGLEDSSVGFGPVINMVLFDSPVEIDGADLDYRILSSGILEDLLINLYQPGPGEPLVVDLHGNPHLYTSEDLAGHHGRFVVFLERLLSDLDRTISAIELVGADEGIRLAQAERGAQAVDLGSPDLLTAFTRQAAAAPESTALVSGDRSLTYQELATRVEVLATLLREAGVGPEVAVAVALPPSLELVVATYAIISAGGQCVPIGTGAPGDRAARIMSIADARILLVHADYPGLVAAASAEYASIPVWRIDAAEEVDQTTRFAIVDERDKPVPESAVGTFFEPGSASSRRGVIVEHRAVLNQLHWGGGEFGYSADDVVVHAMPPAAGGSVVGLFAPLVAGATMVLPDGDGGADPQSLLDDIARTGATSVYCDPATLSTMVEMKAADTALDSLRSITVSGGELTPEVASQARQAWRSIALRRMRGWAETAGQIILREPELDDLDTSVAIGTPAWNSTAMVLDERLKRVPVGVPGELYLGGAQLARGYASRPDVTAERIVANPHGRRGERMFRTGDRVRRLSDGRLELLSRSIPRELKYWIDELDGLEGADYLGVQRQEASRTAESRSSIERLLPGDATAELEALADRLRVTPFQLLHAALSVVLARLSGRSDIAVKATIAGEIRATDAVQARQFDDCLVIRTEISPSTTLNEVIAAGRVQVARAQRYADITFEDVDAALASTGRTPIQIMSRWQRRGAQTPVRHRSGHGATADVEITFTQIDEPDNTSIGIGVSYSPGFAGVVSMEALAGQILRVVTALMAQPTAAVGSVDLVSTSTIRDLTEIRPVGSPGTLRDLIIDLEHRKDRSPVAISGARRVERPHFESYTSQLARELISRGVGPGVVVAIAIARSAESVIATVAVAKTGAAFVSIDPRYPVERQTTMLSDSGAKLGLCASAAGVTLDTESWPDMAWIDLSDPDVERRIAGYSVAPVEDDELTRRPDIDDLAYLIYTSGSTGVPKAAAVPNRGLRNFTANQLDKFGLTSADKVVHVASPSFDASVLELLSAIGSGAELVVAPAMVYAGADLESLITENGATHIFLTPSVLATVDPDKVPSLRNVMAGGEALPQEIMRRWARDDSSGSPRLFNCYGPTENTIYAVWSDALTDPEAQVPLGRPLDGVRAYILDLCLRPVPDGVAGQLYLAGPQLAHGYHNRSGLSATTFIADPFVPGDRMYATGDRVVRAGGGDLFFQGRIDFQLKIRGQRVEPGEVDALLGRHRDVINSVTVGVEGPGGHTALVSYAQTRSASKVTPDDLINYLVHRLPGHMVPQRILLVEDFALTAVGKIDRRALPDVDLSTNREYVAPRTPLEEVIAEIFARILGVNRVSVDVGFFEAGGDSLAAVKLATALAEATGRRLAVETLLEASTIAQIAEHMETIAHDSAVDSALTPQPRPDVVPVSEVQRGMWLLNRTDPDSPAYNIAFALRLSGELDPDIVKAAATDLVERQVALRTYYPMVDGEPAQREASVDAVLEGLELDPVDVSESPLEIVARTVGRGFDVTAEPPFRMALLRTGVSEHIVVFVVHHISADGSSLKVLANDFLGSAGMRMQGRAPEFVPLSVDYLDFTLWQRDRLAVVTETGETERQRQLAYWRTRLTGAPEQLSLPADRPRPQTPSFVGASVEFKIPAGLVTRLESIGRGRNATIFDVVHSAYAVFLGRMASTDDVVIGTAYAGRVDPALENLVGMFVNSLPLRSQLRRDEGFDALVSRVHADNLKDMSNADVAFESIVEATGIRRSSSINPVFQAMLLFQNFEFPVVELPGLTITLVDEGFTAAQVDLQLTIYPSDPLQLGAQSSGESMRAAFVYATDLFDPATIEKYSERFMSVLEAVAEEPEIEVGDISIAGHADLVTVPDNSSAPISLVHFVEEKAAVEPSRVAVSYSGTAITFGDLAAMTTVLTASLPDADSALVTALMSLIPDLATAGAEALGEVMASIRQNEA